MRVKPSSLYLYIPMFIVIAVDILLTLQGNRYYFTGEVKEMSEVNPIGRFFISHGFWVFVAAGVGYLSAWFVAVHALPYGLRITSFLVVVVLHTYASATWLDERFHEIFCGRRYIDHGCTDIQRATVFISLYGILIAYAVLTSVFLSLSIRKRSSSAI